MCEKYKVLPKKCHIHFHVTKVTVNDQGNSGIITMIPHTSKITSAATQKNPKTLK